MSKEPNSEQLMAIEHDGGVLLRAGAGSGKTFVLIEHILYLTKGWINEFKKNPQGSFEDFIRLKFSQMVMMTFTKKAAGEMSIRLTERFMEAGLDSLDDNWRIVNESLPVLTVTTIDGFCRKLITNGYFPSLSTEAKIIFGPERTDQVRVLVKEWIDLKGESVDQDVMDIVTREKRDLLSAITNVFNDPGLRLSWKKFKMQDIHPDNLSKLLSMSFELNDLTSALSAILSLDLPEESERSAFEHVVANFQSTGLPIIDNVDKFKIYQSLFIPIKVLSGERSAKKKTDIHVRAHEGLKAIRDWIKKWEDVLDDYEKHFETKVKPWMKLCHDLFTYVDQKLDPNEGMTFGDVEYFVALGLEDKTNQIRIQNVYKYFIVDEFQDTSELQFKIIRSLIAEDFDRLFCVGDTKQAIYGFRGGELSVFQDCGDLVPSILSLANNYRSLPEIIEFNNSLFRTILPLGQEFEGHDPFTVKPENQNIPKEVERNEFGVIEIHNAEICWNDENEEKFSTEDINRFEARLIADSILKERLENSHNVCTVLYSKLRPSGELIRALMERNIGFTAQFKIDLLDDPILGIFLCLLKRKFDSRKETKNRYPIFLIQSYLDILCLPSIIREEDLAGFDQNVIFWGLTPAFRKFLHKLSISNENSDINLATIETFSKLYYQDAETIMIQFQNGDNDRLSLDLRSGDQANMVQIMSAHASKGLEFDTVYLGGIYTNGKDMYGGSLFGNLPGSFNWYIDLVQKEKQLSPLYVYENELSRYKNFSESKRLFYVAATRAKKKLVWINFIMPEKSFSIPKNSWINGLKVWLRDVPSAPYLRQVEAQNFNAQEILAAESLPELPFFFHDAMGIFSKGEGESELLIAAELSVTKLNSLLDCPRKFFLSNVLKLTATEEAPSYVKENDNDQEEELAQVMRSSSERGTYIHAQIAQGILRNFVVPRESFATANQAPVEWVLATLKKLQADYEMVPEQSLKFKFFNFMISGTPDLILFSKTQRNAQVWDFKTGRMTQDKLKHYWLQLTVYAYALYELGKVEKNHDIDLVLSFVDQKENLTEKVSWQHCTTILYPIWRSQNEPWNINSDHCSQCSYGDICPR